MRDGDPWDTRERDATRARQRRVLAEIPSWVVEAIRVETGLAQPDPVVEAALRARAQDLIDEVPQLLERFRGHTMAAALCEGIGRIDAYDAAVEALHHEAQAARSAAWVSELDEHAEAVVRRVREGWRRREGV